jgi:hypothetical protein
MDWLQSRIPSLLIMTGKGQTMLAEGSTLSEQARQHEDFFAKVRRVLASDQGNTKVSWSEDA